MKRVFFPLAGLFVLVLLLTWWFPALFLALLPHEVAFLVGLLGFWVLGVSLWQNLSWGLTLWFALLRGRLSQEDALTRVRERLAQDGEFEWKQAWLLWWHGLSTQRALFYGLFWLVTLVLLVLHLGVHPALVSLRTLWQGFFWGAASTAFLTWTLEMAVQDALAEL